jgi:hypothetical protein
MGGGQVNSSWGCHNVSKNFSSLSSLSTNECNGASVRTPPSNFTVPAADSPRTSVLKVYPVPFSKIRSKKQRFRPARFETVEFSIFTMCSQIQSSGTALAAVKPENQKISSDGLLDFDQRQELMVI